MFLRCDVPSPGPLCPVGVHSGLPGSARVRSDLSGSIPDLSRARFGLPGSAPCPPGSVSVRPGPVPARNPLSLCGMAAGPAIRRKTGIARAKGGTGITVQSRERMRRKFAERTEETGEDTAPRRIRAETTEARQVKVTGKGPIRDNRSRKGHRAGAPAGKPPGNSSRENRRKARRKNSPRKDRLEKDSGRNPHPAIPDTPSPESPPPQPGLRLRRTRLRTTVPRRTTLVDKSVDKMSKDVETCRYIPTILPFSIGCYCR